MRQLVEEAAIYLSTQERNTVTLLGIESLNVKAILNTNIPSVTDSLPHYCPATESRTLSREFVPEFLASGRELRAAAAVTNHETGMLSSQENIIGIVLWCCCP